jgi:hypothetical protein
MRWGCRRDGSDELHGKYAVHDNWMCVMLPVKKNHAETYAFFE